MMKAAGPDFPMPTPEEQKEHTKAVISQPGGVLQFVTDGDEERIKVWFGSREKYEAIPKKWDDIVLSKPIDLPSFLNHGFDETKSVEELGIEDMRQAAAFRGGKCLSEMMAKGDMYTALTWQCASGHEFKATPYTVLFAGHWCPECMCGEWRYGEEAEVNPFFAQVWKPLHEGEENFRVKMIADAKMIDKLYE